MTLIKSITLTLWIIIMLCWVKREWKNAFCIKTSSLVTWILADKFLRPMMDDFFKALFFIVGEFSVWLRAKNEVLFFLAGNMMKACVEKAGLSFNIHHCFGWKWSFYFSLHIKLHLHYFHPSFHFTLLPPKATPLQQSYSWLFFCVEWKKYLVTCYKKLS